MATTSNMSVHNKLGTRKWKCFADTKLWAIGVVALVTLAIGYPLPLGWSGWVEGFCSYILGGRWKWPPKGSTQSVFLQNPPTSWTRTSLQNHSTQPHFFGALSPKSHSTKSQPLKTSISVIFSPLDFERVKKNKRDFVEKTLGNPTCDTHFLELISHHIPTYQKQPLSHWPSFSHFGPV